MSRPTSPALLAILAATASGVEAPVADLRLVAEARPAAFSYAWSKDGATRSGDDGFDRALAVGMGGRWGWGRAGSPHLLLAGAEALWSDERFGDGGLAGPLVRLEAGWGYALSERWLATATGVGGIAWRTFTTPGGALGDDRLRGTGGELGLRAGLRWSLDRRWGLAGEGGWLTVRDRLQGAGARLDLDRSAAWLGIALSWTIDPGPRPLD